MPRASAKAADPKLPPALPPFGDLSARKLEGLARKMLEAKDSYGGGRLMDKAGVVYAQRAPLAWHLVQHGLLAADHPSVLQNLCENLRAASDDALFAAVASLGRQPVGGSLLLPGWSVEQDLLVRAAWERDRARLLGLLSAAPPAQVLGIWLVAGRLGEPVPAEPASALLSGLAQQEATAYNLPRRGDGAQQRLDLRSPSGVSDPPFADGEALARCFGSPEQWREAVLPLLRQGGFLRAQGLASALVALPLPELVELLSRLSLQADDDGLQLQAILDALRCDPAELARLVAAAPWRSSQMREQTMAVALLRLHDQGQALPEGLELKLTWSTLGQVLSPWSSRAHLARLFRRVPAALGRERCHALAEALMVGVEPATIGTLLRHHPDPARIAAMLQRYVEAGLVSGQAYGLLGAPGLPLLLERACSAPDAASRAAWQQAIRLAIGLAGAEGQALEPAWAEHLSVLPGEGLWLDHERESLICGLRAFPEALRQEVLLRLSAQPRGLERALWGLLSIEDPAFRLAQAGALARSIDQVQDLGTLKGALRRLGPDGLQLFASALSSAPPRLVEQLAEVHGRGPVEALQQLGG